MTNEHREEVMRLIHADDEALSVPEKFSAQYAHFSKEYRFPIGQLGGRTVAEVEADLKAASGDAEAIRAVLPSWCSLTCDECEGEREVLVRFGSEPDFDVRWQDLCVDCLTSGVALSKASQKGEG